MPTQAPAANASASENPKHVKPSLNFVEGGYVLGYLAPGYSRFLSPGLARKPVVGEVVKTDDRDVLVRFYHDEPAIWFRKDDGEPYNLCQFAAIRAIPTTAD